jgi:hypothetical protein
MSRIHGRPRGFGSPRFNTSRFTIAATFVSLSRQDSSLKLLRPRERVQAALGARRLLDHIPTFEDETGALVSFRPHGHSAGT